MKGGGFPRLKRTLEVPPFNYTNVHTFHLTGRDNRPPAVIFIDFVSIRALG